MKRLIRRFQGIGAYLMEDSTRGYTIRAGSTTTSFAQRFKEHLKCSKLRNDTDRDSILYSSYPHKDATEAYKNLLIEKPKGEWRNIDSDAIIGWDKGKTIISLLYPHHKHRFDNNKVNTKGSKITF
jgi:hypothetical protein